MKPVDINLVGRSYQVACEPGEEKRLQELGAMLEEKMLLAAKSGPGAMSEIRLFLLAGLMLADDVMETRMESQQSIAEARRGVLVDEDMMVSAVDHLAGRISALVEKIESA